VRIGITGLPSSGKTSLFKALIGKNIQIAFDRQNIGSVKVPDEELYKLSEIFKPKKTTPAEITFVDIPGIPTGIENKKRRNEIFSAIRKVDALVEVIDGFSTLENIENAISSFDSDLIIMDLDVVEKRLERLKKEKKDTKKEREQEILGKCKETLEMEKPLSEIGFTEEELSDIRSFEFFTLKPILYVINIADSFIGKSVDIKNKVKQVINKNYDVIAVPVELEVELSELSEEEKQEFLSSYGLSKPILPEFIDASYRLLGYETFYTVGEDEVKAWTIKKGTNARKAAGKIHSDIERGFIAAEVVSYKDFESVGFSFKEAKAKGVLRIEGENYIVQDKDIVHFRFNV
jgi:GTP-binding protein YchF